MESITRAVDFYTTHYLQCRHIDSTNALLSHRHRYSEGVIGDTAGDDATGGDTSRNAENYVKVVKGTEPRRYIWIDSDDQQARQSVQFMDHIVRTDDAPHPQIVTHSLSIKHPSISDSNGLDTFDSCNRLVSLDSTSVKCLRNEFSQLSNSQLLDVSTSIDTNDINQDCRESVNRDHFTQLPPIHQMNRQDSRLIKGDEFEVRELSRNTAKSKHIGSNENKDVEKALAIDEHYWCNE